KMTATPDSLTQDGASQAGIAVSATNATGQVISGLSFHLDVAVACASGVTGCVNGKLLADYGTLSARNIVTGTDGKAQASYPAPDPPPPRAGGSGTTLTIFATPRGSNNQTAVSYSADIRLVPPGVILPPADTPTAIFSYSPSPVNLNVPATFDGSASCPGAAD